MITSEESMYHIQSRVIENRHQEMYGAAARLMKMTYTYKYDGWMKHRCVSLVDTFYRQLFPQNNVCEKTLI